MPLTYLPILLFIFFGILLGILALTIGQMISPKRAYASKLNTYECGFSPFEDARFPFSIHYYRVAILFVIFDIETAFLLTWAASLREIGPFALLAMMPFLGALIIGFIYEWKKGALEWT